MKPRPPRIIKTDIIDFLVKNGIPFEYAGKSIDLIFEAIANALRSDKRVELRNFGSFNPKLRAGGYSGITKKRYSSQKTVKFVLGKNFFADDIKMGV